MTMMVSCDRPSFRHVGTERRATQRLSRRWMGLAQGTPAAHTPTDCLTAATASGLVAAQGLCCTSTYGRVTWVYSRRLTAARSQHPCMMNPSPPEASGLSGLMLFAQQPEKLSMMRCLLLLLVPFRCGISGGRSVKPDPGLPHAYGVSPFPPSA